MSISGSSPGLKRKRDDAVASGSSSAATAGSSSSSYSAEQVTRKALSVGLEVEKWLAYMQRCRHGRVEATNLLVRNACRHREAMSEEDGGEGGEDGEDERDRSLEYLQAAIAVFESEVVRTTDIFLALKEVATVEQCDGVAQMLCDADKRKPVQDTHEVISLALDLAIRRETLPPALARLITHVLRRSSRASKMAASRRSDIQHAINSSPEQLGAEMRELLQSFVSADSVEPVTEAPDLQPRPADGGLLASYRHLTQGEPHDSSGPALVLLWQAMHEGRTSSSSAERLLPALPVLAAEPRAVLEQLASASIEVLEATLPAVEDEDMDRPWPEWVWVAHGFGQWVQAWQEQELAEDMASVLENARASVSDRVAAIDARLEALRQAAQVDTPLQSVWETLREGLLTTTPPRQNRQPMVATWSDYSTLHAQLGARAANWTLRHDPASWRPLADTLAELLSADDISSEDAALLASPSSIPLLEIAHTILGPTRLFELVTRLLQRLADPENLVVSVLDDSQGPLTAFGYIVLLAHNLQRHWAVPLPAEARSDRIFALSELTPDELACMSGWVQALFGVSGIGDDLLQATPPGRFLRLAPTLISQAIAANDQGIIDASSLANGLSYFAQPLLSWSQICMLRTMADELEREPTAVTLGVIRTLLESAPPAVLEAVTPGLVPALAIARHALPAEDFTQVDALIRGQVKRRTKGHKVWDLCAWVHQTHGAAAARYISTDSRLDAKTVAAMLSSRWGRNRALLVDVDVDAVPLQRLQVAVLATMIRDRDSAKAFVAKTAAARASPQADQLLRWIVDDVGPAAQSS